MTCSAWSVPLRLRGRARSRRDRQRRATGLWAPGQRARDADGNSRGGGAALKTMPALPLPSLYPRKFNAKVASIDTQLSRPTFAPSHLSVSIGETVGIGISGDAKCWSKWQDLNLRPSPNGES